MPSNLPCGCSKCGCACATHSTTRREEPCAQHRPIVVTRFIIGEAATLVALALFVGMVGIWAKIFGG